MKSRLFILALLPFALAVPGLAQANKPATPPVKPAVPTGMTPATPKPAAPASTQGAAASPRKPLKSDEVFFSIGRRINAQTNALVSGIVGELDNVISVKEIVMGADGRATVTVLERAPSNASSTQKSIDLKFSPAAEDKWTWDEFQDGKRFYPAERVFSYAQGDLNKKKQMIAAKWANFAMSVNKQSDAAIKAAETAKAVLKAEVNIMPTLQALRTSISEALKQNDADGLISAYRDLSSACDTVLGLADSYNDLKANDAYLRLQEEVKAAIAGTNAAKRDYVETVNLYNESLQRLPFALVAYGLEFQRIEPKLTAE